LAGSPRFAQTLRYAEIVSTDVFDNEQSGYKQLLQWMKKSIDCEKLNNYYSQVQLRLKFAFA